MMLHNLQIDGILKKRIRLLRIAGNDKGGKIVCRESQPFQPFRKVPKDHSRIL